MSECASLTALPFAVYEGCGNDFVFIDNRSAVCPLHFFQNIPSICQDSGTDGVILLENSTICDYKMRIFNADGTEAEMCGNGIRCLARFIQALGDKRSILRIETMERELGVTIDGEQIQVDMGMPCDLRWGISLSIQNQEVIVYHVNTGVPHAVIFGECPHKDFESFGRILRYHPYFAPDGANINLATLGEDGIIDIRTYERGVEAETQACGTGATAVAFVASRLYNKGLPITIRTRSRELLHVALSQNSGLFGALTITGPANFVCNGRIELSNYSLTSNCPETYPKTHK